jgi:uncharacterized membrane protein
MNRIRAWTGVLLVFLLGAASGIAGATVFYRKRLQQVRRDSFPFPAEDVAQKLRAELRLNPDQSAQLEKITAETRLELRRFQEKTRPQAMEIVRRAGIQVRAFLTPEQAEKFDALRKRAIEKHQERQRSLQRQTPEKPPLDAAQNPRP